MSTLKLKLTHLHRIGNSNEKKHKTALSAGLANVAVFVATVATTTKLEKCINMLTSKTRPFSVIEQLIGQFGAQKRHNHKQHTYNHV